VKTDKIATTCQENSQMSRDLLPLNALRAFEAAARLNSVSQAAEQLHVTHGAVSRQLKVLEEHLGVSLFVKDGRGLKLTDAGIRLRDASFEAFERLRDTCAELTQSSADAPFVLGCSGSLLARWFIPRLGRLNADLPDLRLHLSAGEGDLDPRRPGLDALLVFAEGTRSRTFGLQPMLAGATRYLDLPETVILPVGITGTEALFPVGGDTLHSVETIARFGRPIEARVLRERAGDDRRLIMDTIGVAIAAVLPPDFKGVYGNGQVNLDDARRLHHLLFED